MPQAAPRYRARVVGQGSGTLKGTFTFHANDNYFHTIKKGSLPVLVTKFHSTGKTCPGGGGGGGTSCGTGYFVSGFDTDSALSVGAFKGLTR